MKKFIVLSLLMAVSAHADDAVSSSCNILMSDAKDRAATQLKEMLGAFTTNEINKQTYYSNYVYFGAATLSGAVEPYRKAIPANAITMAKDVAALRDQRKSLQDERNEKQKKVWDLQAKLQDKKQAHKKTALQKELDAASSELKDLNADAKEIDSLLSDSEAKLRANMKAVLDRRDERSFTESNYKEEALKLRFCGGETRSQVETPHAEGIDMLSVCEEIDLKSGAISYKGVVSTEEVVDLGSIEPVLAAKNTDLQARTKQGLEARQLKKLPQVCQNLAAGKTVRQMTLADSSDAKIVEQKPQPGTAKKPAPTTKKKPVESDNPYDIY